MVAVADRRALEKQTEVAVTADFWSGPWVRVATPRTCS
jgi:hypothetical protein